MVPEQMPTALVIGSPSNQACAQRFSRLDILGVCVTIIRGECLSIMRFLYYHSSDRARATLAGCILKSAGNL